MSTVPEPFGGRDQTPHDSFGVTEVGGYAGTVKQVPAFGEGPDLAEFPWLVIVVVAVSENCYDFSLSNLSAYLISSYLGASLIFSHNNLHIVRLSTRVRLAHFAQLNTRMDMSCIQTPTRSI